MSVGGIGERRITAVPASIRVLLVAALAAQIGWHAWRPDLRAEIQALPPAPAMILLRLAALDEETVLAKLLMLQLQGYDNQPGVSIPFMNLDYDRVVQWLDVVIDLDPRAGDALLAAARLYGSVPDPVRQRKMFALVYRRFFEDPNRRWPWLAHAAVIAKHRLADPVLALQYARAVTEYAVGAHVPAWAREMSIIIAVQMGEFETVRILIDGLLDRGQAVDPETLRFLDTRLAEIESSRRGAGVPGRVAEM